MNILAFDISTNTLSIALEKDDNSIIEIYKENIKNQNEELLPTLNNFLKSNDISLNNILYIALGIGPGSFTALRIAFATIKTICYAKNIPIIGVPSLEVLYQNIKEYNGIKACMIDARKGSIYADIYYNEKKIKENLDVTYQEFIDIIKNINNNNDYITLCGYGFCNNIDFFTNSLQNIKKLDNSYHKIKVSNTIILSKLKYNKKQFDDVFSLLPLYIRKSEAENKKNLLN